MHGRISRIERLTPSYLRIELSGEGLHGFEPSPCADAYINAALPPPGAPYEAPFELDELRSLPREQRPFRRRYTVRRWLAEPRTLSLEFTVHETDGPGARWALGARPGDALVFTGPAGSYRPDPDADWHLLVGDESALPAIGAALEAIPAGAPVVVRALVDGPGDELELVTPGRLDLSWVHRDGGEPGPEVLADAVRAVEAPGGRVHAFVHGEAEETRAVRRHLLAERGAALEDLSCSPYWKRGMSDEQWREIKASWVAEVAREAA